MLRPRRTLPLWLLGAALAATSTACIGILGEFEVGGDGTTAPNSSSPEGAATPVLCTDPTAPACGEGARCVDTSGKAVCVCNEGYEGPECTSCAPGLQDFDGDRVCKPTCATARTTCPAHASCDDASGEARCVCAVGYAFENDACVWRGALRDPSFEEEPGGWELTEFVSSSTAPGATPADRGYVSLPREKVCAGQGSLRQTFAMPSVALGEPYALKTMANLVCEAPDGGTLRCGVGSVSFKTSLTYGRSPTSPGNAWTESSKCLGERAYGPGVELRIDGIQPFFRICSGSGSRDLRFDRIDIVPDPACPRVGAVLNGDFEGNGGWTAGGTAADTSAEVVASVGNGGSRGGRLTATKYCPTSDPTLTTLMSVPSASLRHAAMTMTFKGPATRGLSVETDFDQPFVGSITGDGTYREVSFCLPDYVKGYAAPLTFRMNREEPTGTATCGGAGDVLAGGREIILDDLRIESKPDSCPENVTINDGGFERNDNVSYWRFRKSASGSFGTTTVAPHGGRRSAYLAVSKLCDNATVDQAITVPPSKPGAGPALKFFYRVAQATPATLTVRSDAIGNGAAVPLEIKAVNTWTEQKLCLKPSSSGSRDSVQFMAFGGNGACTEAITAGTLYIDDVVVDTDPSCPTSP